jgi:hypothetical protein
MPPLTDPAILAYFHSALSNWNVTDYVTEKDTALEWRMRNPSCLTLKDVEADA